MFYTIGPLIRVKIRRRLSRIKVDCHCLVIYVRTRVNEIEAVYEVSRIDVRVERVSTLTFTRDSSLIASIVFTHINFTRVRT